MDLKDLEYIKTSYTDGWNGEGSKSIDPEVYQNTLSVIESCDQSILDLWDMSLNVNGSIYFMAKYSDAMINLGNKSFSYYIRGVKSSDYEVFSKDSVIEILKLSKS